MNNSTLEYLECPDCSNKYVSMLDQYGRFVKGAQFTNLLDKNTPETFSEWYRKEYQEEWNKEEHSYDFALKMSNEYAKWCKSVKITPDWR